MLEKREADVIIIGGGPGGIFSAYELTSGTAVLAGMPAVFGSLQEIRKNCRWQCMPLQTSGRT